MTDNKNQCPLCGTPMEEGPAKVEPHANPKIAAQQRDHATAGVVVNRLECPKCHHAEGRLPKGKGGWKDELGRSTL